MTIFKSNFHALLCAIILPFLILIVSMDTIKAQDCGTNFDLKKLKRDNPTAYQEFLRIEKLTEDYVKRMKGTSIERLIDQNGIITVPVVIHVLHLGETIGTASLTTTLN